MQFNATLDRTTIAITIGVTVILIGVNAFVFSQMARYDDMPLWAVVPPVAITVGVLVGCYLFRPLGYVLERDRLVVKRPIADVIIPKEQIRDAYVVSKGDMGWIFRTFGNGGMFGWTGRFSSSRLGSMTWYATRRSNYLVIETSSKKILLTPDDTNMVSFIRKRLLEE